MKLCDTAKMMVSADYKERFKAEYMQLKIRYYGLNEMVKKWDKGELDFKPTCPREIYNSQLTAMSDYLNILEDRAKIENVDLS